MAAPGLTGISPQTSAEPSITTIHIRPTQKSKDAMRVYYPQDHEANGLKQTLIALIFAGALLAVS